MADRTVRAIFEARVTGARKGMTDLSKDVANTGKKVDGLTKDLKTLDGQKVKPQVDVELDAAKKRLNELVADLADLKTQEPSLEVDFKIEQAKAAIKDVRSLVKDLTSQTAEVRIDAATKDAQKRISDITQELGLLRTMEVTPQVEVDIKAAQKKLRDAKTELRELSGAKAKMTVTADTSQAETALDEVGDAGERAGDDAGEGIASGILGALKTIPIAGAVIGVGAAIAFGIVAGIKDGLQIEVGRDLFSARTGLDEASSARFGRAAGEAYANAWGDSVEGNLDTARTALEQGLIDPDAVSADVEQVISSLEGISDIMEADIPAAARAAGQLIKTGLVKNADEAFDVIVAGYQNGADASQDFLDTLIEYPTHFRDLGLSAEDATGLLIQGMEGGAFNADKVADSLKELTIKVKEMPKDTTAAFKTLQLNGEAMQDAFVKGGPAARDALDQILTKLSAVKDPSTQAALAVALFGTQAEDMAGALANLNLDKAAGEIGGVAGAAGSAERALATMSDNASSKMETAKRNVETAMDGIKGALAAAFGDDIGNVSDWVTRNRGALMQFFLDVINGAFDMAESFAEFSAQGLEGIGALADGFASLVSAIDIIPGIDMSGAEESLRGLADGARAGAQGIRENVPAALDEARDKANEWAAPAILEAHIHDATLAMAGDMDAFSAKVAASGGTVTINGETINAEEALKWLTENINGEDGTVTINGDKVPAEDALDVLMRAVDTADEDITIGANTRRGEGDLRALKGKVSMAEASMQVYANTATAEREIDYLSRDRFAYLNIKVRGGTQLAGAHDGGFVGRGLHAGGWVPGSDPGYDNVMWPLHSGGKVLNQPLAGDEFVVNSKDAAANAPLLEFLNAGGRVGAANGQAAAPVLDVSALQDAMSGMSVVMDGQKVGRLVTTHQRRSRENGGM